MTYRHFFCLFFHEETEAISGAGNDFACNVYYKLISSLFFLFFQEEMDAIVALIDKDLSEPYSILTYRYFVYNWSQV